jgi:hypothetical protein
MTPEKQNNKPEEIVLYMVTVSVANRYELSTRGIVGTVFSITSDPRLCNKDRQLRHNLMHKSSLAGNLCIPRINVT